ncbi:GNAT family acetyltransferase [Pelagibius sp. Alg239-R121]|uniref:GNAT family acetyltransferase n=1 Tax=Pelagibius sp. Alg239-R121 TaxID=2993448 RepID=UPI0024A64828|nr:GNAT family acetyltransferase [Pelagibius sp. Alg239-R121]
MTGESNLKLRPYAAADRDDVVAVWKQCGLLVWYNDPDQDIARWLENPSSEIIVGVLDDQIVATVCVGYDGHRGRMNYLACLPEHRGRGFASCMASAAEEWLRERKVPKVELLIRETNLGVKKFYRRIGYHRNTCHIMQRWLVDGMKPPGNEATTAEGKLENVITYLEMNERPVQPVPSVTGERKVALLRCERPPLAFYRFLYDTIGEPCLWWERRSMDDETLSEIIHDSKVEIYVLYVDGAPAGYAELDRRLGNDIELAYFGLMPDFIGQGLGSYLLTSAIDIAWSYSPDRLHLHTNTLDHPRALPVYQRCGFKPYKQEKTLIDDPRLTGRFPA